MFRHALTELRRWIDRPGRKPLIIRGARQVGKTWLVRQLAAETGRALVELNFERTPAAAGLFESRDPRVVVSLVEAWSNARIDPEHSVLFLDEIQSAPEVLSRLRWFAEELPELPVVAAGSLLDFVLADHSFSMPVGRVEYLHLEPMGFSEFLLGTGGDGLWQAAEEASLRAPIARPLHDRLLAELAAYSLVGGLPEAVEAWRATRSYVEVARVQTNLLTAYRDDFARYGARAPRERLNTVLRAVPTLLGRKFKFSAVDRHARAAAVRAALDLLTTARVCHRVRSTDGTGVPLGAGARERGFKVILLDVGLASSLLGLGPLHLPRPEALVLANKGAIAEQLAGQALRLTGASFMEPDLFYWTREQKGSAAELDYLYAHGPQVVPIEVKAGATGSLKSLHQFMAGRQLELGVRLNTDVASLVDVDVRTSTGAPARYRLLSLPLYLTERLPDWIADLDAG